MATLVFTALGTAVGGPLGGAIGAIVGRQADRLLFSPGIRQGPRLSELGVSTSSYGVPLPRHYGRMRVGGQIIWATELVEHREKQGGGKGKPSTMSYSYTASFAVALSSRPIRAVTRVWADGKLLRGAAGDLKVGGRLRVYDGRGDQLPDPLIEAAEGATRCPAWRGLAYVLFEDLQLGEFGNRIPALTFELEADSGPIDLEMLIDGDGQTSHTRLPLPGLLGLSCEGSTADLLSTLGAVYPLTYDGCDDGLSIRFPPDAALSSQLPEPALPVQPDHSQSTEQPWSAERAAASRQRPDALRYYDIDRDYMPGAQRALGAPHLGSSQVIELPAAMTADTARQLICAAGQRQAWGNQTVHWRLCQIDQTIAPGSLVCLPDRPGRWQVQAWEWSAQGLELTLNRCAPVIAHGGVGDAGHPLTAADLANGPTSLVAYELPWDGNPSTALPRIMVTASSTAAGWKGASLFLDQGDGRMQPLGPCGQTRGIIGHTRTVLPARSPLLFDRHSTVEVELISDGFNLQSVDQMQLDAGANRALLGDEIIQFARADRLDASRWRLSGLWRGRGGTEAAVKSHRASEAFVLLDGSGLMLDPALAATTTDSMIKALGLADETAASSKIALWGIGKRPLSPVHGKVTRQADGSIALRWTRRARGAWEWNLASDTPLNEQAERYQIGFGTAAATIATWYSKGCAYVLPAEAINPLIAAYPDACLTIRQVGDHALSAPLAISLPSI